MKNHRKLRDNDEDVSLMNYYGIYITNYPSTILADTLL